MHLLIPDEVVEDLVSKQVNEVLSNFKMQFATVDIEQLSEITSLSRSTLLAKFTSEPEIVEVTRRIGKRVVYLYPEVIEAYKTVLERVSS